MNIIFLGPQGSGKSTQAKLLAEYLGVPLFDTGGFYRKKREENSPLGRKIKKIIDAGNLVPDEITIKLVNEEFKKPKYKNGVVIDGVPRTLRQAEELSIRPHKVFYLKVSDEEGVKRLLKRGRHDDTPEAIQRRLELYHAVTEPILGYYREKGLLEEIDGERSIEEIAQDIREHVKKNDHP